MKTRNGFVSNSSSTSFTFIFKGRGIEDLFRVLRKYNQYFDLYCEYFGDNGCHISVEDVISAMKSTQPELELLPIKKFGGEVRKEVNLFSKELEGLDNKERGWMEDYYTKCLNRKLGIQSIAEGAFKLGFSKVFLIGFGDNHGNICGGEVGYAMDYEGRNININKPDLIVFTEQNR